MSRSHRPGRLADWNDMDTVDTTGPGREAKIFAQCPQRRERTFMSRGTASSDERHSDSTMYTGPNESSVSANRRA